jgi:xylan 1,4-beta-xylosidase
MEKYYFQYGAPGTEFSGYADGVVVVATVNHCLMEYKLFTPQSDPLSYQAGWFFKRSGTWFYFPWITFNNYWHISTIALSAVKNTWERRMGIWPVGFDKDDVMYCNTAFGDYPQYLPDAIAQSRADHLNSIFTGWMLLNYKKPVQVSSSISEFLCQQCSR